MLDFRAKWRKIPLCLYVSSFFGCGFGIFWSFGWRMYSDADIKSLIIEPYNILGWKQPLKII